MPCKLRVCQRNLKGILVYLLQQHAWQVGCVFRDPRFRFTLRIE